MAERACSKFTGKGEGKAKVKGPVEVYIALIQYVLYQDRNLLASIIEVCATDNPRLKPYVHERLILGVWRWIDLAFRALEGCPLIHDQCDFLVHGEH